MSLLPLDLFRQQIGYNPWHFWGLENAKVPVTSSCNGLLKKYDWQDFDAASRSEITEAIETAEARLLEYLGFAPAPHYLSETHPYPQWQTTGEWRLSSIDADGRWVSVRMSEGYIQQTGVETLSVIDASVSVIYSDEDGDGLDETFTVIVPTTVTDTDEIAVYFTATDRLDSDGVGEAWRIAPVKVSLSGGNATIIGRSWLLVRPILYEGAVTPDHLDPDTTGNFVTDVAVYRRYTALDGTTTATSQGVLTWESYPWPGWAICCGCGNGNNSTDPASYAQAVARVGIRDSEKGIVIPGRAAYDTVNGVWSATWWNTCRPPDRVTIRYLAGWPLENSQMSKKWQAIVARLAAAELAVRICTDNVSSHVLHRWQFDRARAAGANDEQYSLASDDLDNPFGTREGHIYAWRQVKHLRRMQGFLA